MGPGSGQMIWVFGYGSLMWDGWENGFGCLRRSIALLQGYRRSFNKASVRNRGTKETPCPTLNVERIEGETCKGMAFAFPEDREAEIRRYLEKREGKDFSLDGLMIRLEDATNVLAHVPIYSGKNLILPSTPNEKATMVIKAAGTMGSCADYVKEVVTMLAQLGIDDPSVSELWQALQRAVS